MTRSLCALPLALTLSAFAAPAFAGPPVSTPAAGGDGAVDAAETVRLAVECFVDDRWQPLSVVGNTMVDEEGPLDGTVTEVEPGVFLHQVGTSTLLLTSTFAQITGGTEAGKYDCQPIVASTAPAPAGDPAAVAALEQRLNTMRGALEASQSDLIAAIAERDRAQAELAGASGASQTAQAEIARLESALAENAAAAGTHASELAQITATNEALEADLVAVQAASVALQAELELATAEIAALQAQVTTLTPAPEVEEVDAPVPEATDETDEMSDDDDAENDSTMMFDADVAMEMIEAADISPISRAALATAVEQARANPGMIEEVMQRLQNVLGE